MWGGHISPDAGISDSDQRLRRRGTAFNNPEPDEENEMNSYRLRLNDRDLIVARLLEIGVNARASTMYRKTHIGTEKGGKHVRLEWEDGCWNGYHDPGLECRLRTHEDLDEMIRCVSTAEIPDDDTWELVDQLENLRSEILGAAEGAGQRVDAAIRMLAGCPREWDEASWGACEELLEHASELKELLENVEGMLRTRKAS